MRKINVAIALLRGRCHLFTRGRLNFRGPSVLGCGSALRAQHTDALFNEFLKSTKGGNLVIRGRQALRLICLELVDQETDSTALFISPSDLITLREGYQVCSCFALGHRPRIQYCGCGVLLRNGWLLRRVKSGCLGREVIKARLCVLEVPIGCLLLYRIIFVFPTFG